MDTNWPAADPSRSVAETFKREGARLRSFIRRRVVDQGDTEDILQEVFYELIEAEGLARPIEQVGAWLFRVARNRITDLLRKRRTRGVSMPIAAEAPGEEPFAESIEDWLPSLEAGPEAAYARRMLIEELDAALEELPEGQKSVFIAHELEGRSFKELAAESGDSVNTLLSRKRYAVLHLRARLQAIYADFIDP